MAVIDSLKLNDGTILYPKTLTSAIYNDGGTERLDNILAKSIYADDEIPTIPLPRDADSLGGVLASGYALKDAGIVEMGKNPNGKYVKYGDGTMVAFNRTLIGTLNITSTWGSWFISPDLSYSFPTTFYDSPCMSVQIESPIGDIATWMNARVSSTGFGGRFARGQSVTVTTTTVGWLAIGRWK